MKIKATIAKLKLEVLDDNDNVALLIEYDNYVLRGDSTTLIAAGTELVAQLKAAQDAD